MNSTRDAMVVVPGFLGSELKRGNDVVWGLRPRLLFKELMDGSVFRALALPAGHSSKSRIHASRLLRAPAMLPGVTSMEPYADLVRGVERVAGHADAVLEFPYDWRLSVRHNAARLADTAEAHLEQWRRHKQGSRDARLNLVCHSMGGLVGRYFCEVLGGRSEVRYLITLGTPFAGSVKAIRALADGKVLRHGAMAARVRQFALQLPGVYELLPRYRCLEMGKEARSISASDLASMGADLGLLENAEATWGSLSTSVARNGPMEGLRPVVGIGQPTLSSLSIVDGEIVFSTALEGSNWAGDGTVFRGSAFTESSQANYVPQRHGALASSKEAIGIVQSILTEYRLGPPQGPVVGLDVPDDAVAGEALAIRGTLPEGGSGICRIRDSDSGRTVLVEPLRAFSEGLRAEVVLNEPGIFHVELEGGGFSPVQEQLLVGAPCSS